MNNIYADFTTPLNPAPKFAYNENMSTKKTSDADQSLFQEAMRNVKRLHTDKLPKQSSPHPLPPKRTHASKMPSHSIESNITPFSIPDIVQPIISVINQGSQLKQFKALQKGELPIDHVLDIHGMTLSTAAEQVPAWLYQCQQQGLRVVRLIHGQGRNPDKPSLKQLIREGLLRNPAQVLAFCDATTNQGGMGATLILLRRK